MGNNIVPVLNIPTVQTEKQFYKITIRSKMPYFIAESIATAVIKSVDVLNPDIKITSIVAPSNVLQVITVRFTREIPIGDIELDEFEVNQAAIGAPAAFAFASAVVLALGVIAAWEVEDLGAVIKTVATEGGSAVRFSAVAAIALVAGGAFLVLRGK